MTTTYIYAIDPGNKQSAYVVLNAEDLRPVDFDILPNEELLSRIKNYPETDKTAFVIEMVASYGIAVGKDVFDTVFWIGRFYEAANGFQSRDRMFRMDVKMNLCHNSRAKDSNATQALKDRFGDKGTKRNPGWFYGFRKDIWQAYALGVTYGDIFGKDW